MRSAGRADAVVQDIDSHHPPARPFPTALTLAAIGRNSLEQAAPSTHGFWTAAEADTRPAAYSTTGLRISDDNRDAVLHDSQ